MSPSMLYLAIGYALGPAVWNVMAPDPLQYSASLERHLRSRAPDLAVRSRNEARRAVAGQAVAAAAAARLPVDGAHGAVHRARRRVPARLAAGRRAAPGCNPAPHRPRAGVRRAGGRLCPIATACDSASRRRVALNDGTRVSVRHARPRNARPTTISAAAAGAGWRSTSCGRLPAGSPSEARSAR